MYTLITPPVFANKDFFDFNKTEADIYLKWILQIKDERLLILERSVQQDLPNWKVNYTKESFSELYDWFYKIVSYRLVTKEERNKIQQQLNTTVLLATVIPIPEQTFTDETVSICSDIGTYFGELLIKQNSLLNWTYKVNSKKYIYYAQPVITKEGSKIDLNPRSIIEVVARKILDKTTTKNEFENLFDVWSGIF